LIDESWRWGNKKAVFSVQRVTKVRRYLRTLLKMTSEGGGLAATSKHLSIPKSRLPDKIRGKLPALFVDESTRLRYSLGKSYLDLLRARRGEIQNVTDGVSFPKTGEELESILRLADEMDVAIVPWGGGTSVVGGVEPLKGSHSSVLTLSLEKMNGTLWVDGKSQLARFQCGIKGPELESRLEQKGFTLGHYPQSFEFSTLGGWIATRSSGQLSTYYGEIASLVRGARVITPKGPVEWTRPVAESAGPEADGMFLGSEGAFGIFTEATVRIRPLPERTEYHGVLFPDWNGALSALRMLAQETPLPSLARLSDTSETALTMAGREPADSALGRGLEKAYLRIHKVEEGKTCLGFLGYDGPEDVVRMAWNRAQKVLRSESALDLGRSSGESWKRERFLLPYLRDDLMDDGLLVETLETGGSWSILEGLHKGLHTSVTRAAESINLPIYLGTHISHAGATGACIYMTMIAPQSDSGRIEEPFQTLKVAAMRAITACGGSISHHHGIGSMHRPWTGSSNASRQAMAIQAVKNALDPHDTMNPGKTLPP
jgi:alkyldihydroxyacetonephosphate synthase